MGYHWVEKRKTSRHKLKRQNCFPNKIKTIKRVQDKGFPVPTDIRSLQYPKL